MLLRRCCELREDTRRRARDPAGSPPGGARRAKAPVSRFSSTVRWREAVAPFHHLDDAAPHELAGIRSSIARRWNSIEPFVTAPRSAPSRFEIALSVVVLPAPLAPSRATIFPSGTSSDTPFSTRMTWS